MAGYGSRSMPTVPVESSSMILGCGIYLATALRSVLVRQGMLSRQQQFQPLCELVSLRAQLRIGQLFSQLELQTSWHVSLNRSRSGAISRSWRLIGVAGEFAVLVLIHRVTSRFASRPEPGGDHWPVLTTNPLRSTRCRGWGIFAAECRLTEILGRTILRPR